MLCGPLWWRQQGGVAHPPLPLLEEEEERVAERVERGEAETCPHRAVSTAVFPLTHHHVLLLLRRRHHHHPLLLLMVLWLLPPLLLRLLLLLLPLQL